MFEFKNKKVLIISPQSWGKMHISKHHYAIELAKRGNSVFFMNPPKKKLNFKFQINNTDHTNISLINYNYYFLYYARFHWRALFDFLFKIQIKHIIKKTNVKFDIVWCFDTNLFSDLKQFNNKMSIYHPVDNITTQNQISLLKTADFVFSVSEVIINDLKKIKPDKEITFINHGLSNCFLKQKKTQLNTNKKIVSYFVGNILIASLDRAVIKKIIIQNPEISFVFIGSYKKSNLGEYPLTVEDVEFVLFLKSKKNVILKGSLHPKKVAQEIQKANMFMVLINPQKDTNKGSNSHKILEYLSTGKVIVSNHISTYAKKQHLIEMVDEMHNEKLPVLFQKVTNNLEYYNSPKLQQKRIRFALENTYEKQISRIESYISSKL